MTDNQQGLSLRHADSLAELGALEPLWNVLQEHHARITPALADVTPALGVEESWQRRRTKYERWLADGGAFFVVAETLSAAVGYAFVTVGPGYSSWATGDRAATLETISVLPEHRGAGVGEALLETVWERLAEDGIEDLAITTAATNIDSHRFYERQGFSKSFVIYYGKRTAERDQAPPH